VTSLCSRCSRHNPPQALFCFFDGAPLPTQVPRHAPRTSADGSLPIPFVFPSGKLCQTFDQLALGCLNEWPAAVQLLKHGDLASFLAGMGRADLSLAAREAANFPDPDLGLDQFLSRLPTSALQPPKLHVEPGQINLGPLRPGQDREWQLHLANRGMALLHGTVSCEETPWLGLGDASLSRKRFQFLHDGTITVHVRGKELRASTKPLQATLTIESNGGNLTVLVTGEAPIKPFSEGVLAGAITPRQIAQKAKAAPKAAAVLFEKGAVAQWYRDNGWIYPVPGPSASGLGAVQQFFEALGLTAPPRVQISDAAVSLAGRAGDDLTHVLTVSTSENRHVYAHGLSDQQWLQVNRPKLNGRTATLKLHVPSVPWSAGGILRAEVAVTANGNQRFVVPVTLTVLTAAPPQPSPTRREGEKRKPSPPAAPFEGEKGRPPPVRAVVAIPVPAPRTEEAVPVVAVPTPPRSQPSAPEPRRADSREAAPLSRRPRRNWLVPLLPVIFLVIGLGVTFGRDLLMWAGR
jgi:hypothetical protein